MYSERVQRIIELKEKLLEDKERQMQLCRTEEERILSNINRLVLELASQHEILAAMDFSGQDFLVFNNYLAFLDANLLSFRREQEKVARRIEETRAELTELLREIKMLETLKAKALSNSKKSANRKEQKRLDDIALRGVKE